MKRLLVLLATLLLLGTAGTVLVAADLSAQSDRVTVTEHARYGDPTLARRANLTMSASLDNHLHWDITYPVGGEAVSEYDFSLTERRDYNRYQYDGLILSSQIEQGLDLHTPADEQTGLARAYRELFDKTALGTKGRMTVRLQDYYEYYPLYVCLDLPGTRWSGLDYEDMAEEDFAQERAVWDAFTDFFKIPVPDILSPIEIHVVKGENGQVLSYGLSATEIDAISCNLFSASAYTDDRCFFAINTLISGSQGEHVDTSLIPGGYGLYSFTYRHVRDEQNTSSGVTVYHPGYDTGIDIDSLAMVYPLDPTAQVQSMHVDPTQTKLLLLTSHEDESIHLTVIDIATMTARQHLRLTDDTSYFGVEHGDDFVLFFFDMSFQLFSIDEQGNYVHQITAPRPQVADKDFDGFFCDVCAYDWDGRYLVWANVLPESAFHTMATTDFGLAVYDSTGLLYYGEYQTGLSVNPDTAHYRYNPLPIALTVTWE